MKTFVENGSWKNGWILLGKWSSKDSDEWNSGISLKNGRQINILRTTSGSGDTGEGANWERAFYVW